MGFFAIAQAQPSVKPGAGNGADAGAQQNTVKTKRKNGLRFAQKQNALGRQQDLIGQGNETDSKGGTIQVAAATRNWSQI